AGARDSLFVILPQTEQGSFADGRHAAFAIFSLGGGSDTAPRVARAHKTVPAAIVVRALAAGAQLVAALARTAVVEHADAVPFAFDIGGAIAALVHGAGSRLLTARRLRAIELVAVPVGKGIETCAHLVSVVARAAVLDGVHQAVEPLVVEGLQKVVFAIFARHESLHEQVAALHQSAKCLGIRGGYVLER